MKPKVEKNKLPIPQIKLLNNELVDLRTLKDKEDFTCFILENSLPIIEEGIKKKKESVVLFDIGNLSLYIVLPKDEFKNALEKILEYNTVKEEYLVCSKIQSLIKKMP